MRKLSLISLLFESIDKKLSDEAVRYCEALYGSVNLWNARGALWIAPSGKILIADYHKETAINFLKRAGIEVPEDTYYGAIKLFQEKTGFVRVEALPHGIGIDIVGEITPEQLYVIKKLVGRYTRPDIEFFFDITIPQTKEWIYGKGLDNFLKKLLDKNLIKQ